MGRRRHPCRNASCTRPRNIGLGAKENTKKLAAAVINTGLRPAPLTQLPHQTNHIHSSNTLICTTQSTLLIVVRHLSPASIRSIRLLANYQRDICSVWLSSDHGSGLTRPSVIAILLHPYNQYILHPYNTFFIHTTHSSSTRHIDTPPDVTLHFP